MNIRLLSAILVLLVTGLGVGYLFWQQEVKYVLPTPVPAHFAPAPLAETVQLDSQLSAFNKQGLFLHFFNPDCPCSRFNVKHFNYLVNTYGQQLQFVVVIPEFADYLTAKAMIQGDIPLLVDKADALANASGVYATPQAVLLDADSRLYYRGNYNKSRYCTQKDSNYAEIALSAYLKGKAAPQLGLLASKSYGCQFFEETTLSLLNF
ncbi:MAG: AhpC/TSA family protein [Bacteroidetes bacterium]|nr:AhpC/TSA family protein [Bacteroidota bacterium]